MAVVLASLASAHARTLRVDIASTATTPDGATWGTAYKTIPAAVSAAADGDAIWVAKGTYPALTVTRGVLLYGGFQGTETDLSERRFRTNATILRGLTVNALNKPFRLDGFSLGTATIAASASGAVVHNLFSSLEITGSPSVRNNVITRGIFGLTLTNSESVVANNTIAYNALAVRLKQFSSPTFANNIIAYNVTAVRAIRGSWGTATWRSNVIHGNRTDFDAVPSPLGANGNTDADPLFASARTGDLHIQPDSPCVDAGSDADVEPGDRDTDDEERVRGAHVDIGADESDGVVREVPYPRIYVSSVGQDTSGGLSWAAAKRTISAALKAVPNGGEIWVAAGQYDGGGVLPFVSLYGGFQGNETTRDARDPNANVTEITGQLRISTGYSLATVDGFTFRQEAVEASGSSPVISRNRFLGAHTGLMLYSNSYPLVTGNVFVGHRRGVFASLSTPFLANNVLTGCGSAVYLESSLAEMVNNTLVGNGTAVLARYGVPTIRNSLIAYNNTGIEIEVGGGDSRPVVSSSCFYGNGLDSRNFGVDLTTDGNFTADPRLAGESGVNPHLQPDSPCRDAGDAAYVNASWTDVDGQPRIQGAGVDIGADESDGTVWTVAPRIIRVAEDGVDANDGATWETAKRTLVAAFDTLLWQGGEVWLSAGTLQGRLATVPRHVSVYGGFSGVETERDQRDPVANITRISDGLRVAAGNTEVVVDGLTLSQAPDPLINCFSGAPLIDRCVLTPHGGAGIRAENASPIISRCTITALGGTSLEANIGIYLSQSSAVVRESQIASCNSGIRLEGGTDAVIHGNTISSCMYGVRAEIFLPIGPITNNRFVRNTEGIRYSPLSANFPTPQTVANNVFTENATAAFVKWATPTFVNNTMVHSAKAAIVSEGAAVTVANGIIAYNSRGIQMVSGAEAPVVRSTCFFGNSIANTSGFNNPIGADGNIAADPIFAIPGADYRPQPGSPAIDAGDNRFVDPTWADLDGMPRIQGPRVDMGAYEAPYVLPPSERALGSLRIAAGLAAAPAPDMALLDADGDGAVTLADAAEWARRMQN